MSAKADAAPRALAAVQQDFRDWLVLADADAAARLAPGGSPGLAVYQNNYRVSLMDSIAASFERLAAWLGDERLAAAAAHYIDRHPPHAWTLDAYGRDFAAFLADHHAADPEITDLAAIDWAIGEAFVAADADPVDAAALGAVDWDSAAIRPVPSLRTLAVTTNADDLWRALARGETPPRAEYRHEGLLLVWRQGFDPVMRRADPVEIRLVEESLRGTSFARICEGLAETMGEGGAVQAAGAVLGRWVGEGLVAALD